MWLLTCNRYERVSVSCAVPSWHGEEKSRGGNEYYVYGAIAVTVLLHRTRTARRESRPAGRSALSSRAYLYFGAETCSYNNIIMLIANYNDITF